MKSALITGIAGQDGWYLSKLLSSKNYKIFGMVVNLNSKKSENFSVDFPDIHLVKGDLTDSSSIRTLVGEIMPDEIYNLGGFSSVKHSYQYPEEVANINGVGLLRILEACKNIDHNKHFRIYQASSSEMFGSSELILKNESSALRPVSPYGVSKVFAHLTAKNYREIFGMHVSSGITFNHESERRSLEFVTRKITNSAAKIRLGLLDKIELGDLNTSRDWGYAEDYVEAMWKMLQMENPDDYVIATGRLHSIRELLKITFAMIGMDGQEEEFINTNPTYIRPAEIKAIAGDNSKAKEVLNWQPKTTFKDIISRMLQFDLSLEAKKANKTVPKIITI